jgi:hypothetical protein
MKVGFEKAPPLLRLLAAISELQRKFMREHGRHIVSVLTDCLKVMDPSYFSDLGSNQSKPLAKIEPDSGRAPHQGHFGHLQGWKPIVAFKQD